MKNIKLFESFALNEKKKTPADYIQEIYQYANILNYMMDEGYMDKYGKIVADITIEDMKNDMKDKFPEVQSWKNTDWAEAVIKDMIAACVDLKTEMNKVLPNPIK